MSILITVIKTRHIKSLGFTLIELLVVVAVLGVLAAGILIAIDPLEQINRGTDAGIKQSVANLGRALQAYNTSHNATYFSPASGATNWLTTLQTSGEIKVIPTNPNTVATTCAVAAGKSLQGNFCYATNGTEAVVYTFPVSKSVKSNCTGTTVAWYVYSTTDGRAGVVCTANATTEPAIGSQTFVAN